MPVDSNHAEYMKWLPRWRRCADFVEGEDAVKEAGTTYLPMLGGQKHDRYLAYKLRAGFYNGAGRTLQKMVGAAFRRDPVIDTERFKAVQAGRDFLDDANLAGMPLISFAESVIREQSLKGRIGVLVDYSETAGRSFLARYTAESVANWSTVRIGGDTILNLVVLVDRPRLESTDGGFTYKERERRRVLRLNFAEGARFYSVEVWEKKDASQPGEDRWFIAETATPAIRGVRLDYIPFWFIGATDLSPEVEKPPILDLVNVNHKHYLLSADHDHGLHWVSLPTPWVAYGAPAKQESELFIGSETAWVLPPGSLVGMLEMAGTGLASQMTRLKQFEHHMDALGSALLAEEPKGVEAADTRRQKNAEKDVTIADIVGTAEIGLNQAVNLALDWMGAPAAVDEKLPITFNREFSEATPSMDEVAEARAAYAAGDLAWDEVVAVYKRAGLVEENVDPEELRQRIAEDLKKHPRPEPPAPPAPAAAPRPAPRNPAAPPAAV